MIVDHSFLIDYLKKIGYIVYPYELRCGYYDNPHYPYRFVDVAAYRNDKFYAFEYKSAGDPIGGALKQIENYTNSFDYVILLVEIPRKGRSGIALNLTRGKRIYEMIGLGTGIWIYSTNKSLGIYSIQEIIKPKLQIPNSMNRKYVEEKFQFYPWRDKLVRASFHLPQKKLDKWM